MPLVIGGIVDEDVDGADRLRQRDDGRPQRFDVANIGLGEARDADLAAKLGDKRV